MKIMVIGYSGSGKSTLASFLGKYYNLPVLFLDTVQWLPGWNERCFEEKDQIVKKFLDEHDQWVIDGNYQKLSFERRLEEADQIIFMNFNRYDCFNRAKQRAIDFQGMNRESMTEGCDEKFDLEFMKWILWEGRKPEHIERNQMICERYPDKVTVICNQKELDQFMDGFKKE